MNGISLELKHSISMKLTYYIASIALVLGLLAACAKDSGQPTAVEQQAPKGEWINLDIDSEFDLLKVAQDEDTLRALQIGQDANKVPHIKLPLGNSTKLRVFLRKAGQQGNDATTTAVLPAEITYNNKTRKYRISAKGPVQLQNAGDKFSQGEWYISAIWGKNAEDMTKPLRHTLASQFPINTKNLSMDQPTEVEVPVVAPWTRIDNSLRKGETLTSLSLQFRPLGVLLALKLGNGTVYPVEIANLKAGFSGFTVNGELSVENVSDQDLRNGSMPQLIPGDSEEQPISPETLILQPFDNNVSPIYIWFYPTEDTNEDAGYEVSFALSSAKRGTMDTRLEAKDRFQSEKADPEFQDFYTVDYTFSKKPEHGTYYVKDYKLRSQLTITEYFLQQYDGRPYGYVELYNPNVDPIVLENYGLIRIVDGETYGKPSSQRNGYLFPQMTSISGNDGTTHRALVLSLALQNNRKSPWTPNSLGINSVDDVKNGHPRAPMNHDYGLRVERVRFVKERATKLGDKYTLQGGRTMLVLMSGHMAAGSTLQDPVPRDKNAPAFPEYINQAFNKGYCQYVVAIDNPYSSTSNNAMDRGVMHMSNLDALALVQKHNKTQKRRRGVDASSLNNLMNLERGSWGFYRDKVATDESHFRARTAVQFTSDSHTHTYRQWYQARLTAAGERIANREYLGVPQRDRQSGRVMIPLPSKVISPGVRRYVGNTKQAWDNLPPFNIQTSKY